MSIVELDGQPFWSLNASKTGKSTKYPWVKAVGYCPLPPLPTGILYFPQFRSHQEHPVELTMSQENRGLWTVYCSSDFSRVAQFIFENVLRFQFELSSFPGLTEVKGHEGRAFTCSHSMSQYKPITIWEYWVAFAVNKIFWGINGKEKKFQRQYFDICISSANKIGLLGKQDKEGCHLDMQICQWTTRPIHTSETKCVICSKGFG